MAREFRPTGDIMPQSRPPDKRLFACFRSFTPDRGRGGGCTGCRARVRRVPRATPIPARWDTAVPADPIGCVVLPRRGRLTHLLPSRFYRRRHGDSPRITPARLSASPYESEGTCCRAAVRLHTNGMGHGEVSQEDSLCAEPIGCLIRPRAGNRRTQGIAARDGCSGLIVRPRPITPCPPGGDRSRGVVSGCFCRAVLFRPVVSASATSRSILMKSILSGDRNKPRGFC